MLGPQLSIHAECRKGLEPATIIADQMTSIKHDCRVGNDRMISSRLGQAR